MAKVKKAKHRDVIGMLQEIQNKYNYLPKKDLIRITEKLGIPLSRTYSLATFYNAFSLKPRGKYLVSLCMGTACHVRGTERILDEIQRTLKIKPDETSGDLQFTLKTVNCLGACALGPLMVINGEYYGKMSAKKVKTILKKYIDKEKNVKKSQESN
ncbi:NAD(P)H-dependent oxidoreductase subunit E [Candidatus Omnitrophota bacterium]